MLSFLTGPIIGLLADKVGGAVGDFFKAKAEGQIIREKAKAQNLTEGIPGYSDDYLVFVWSFPTLAAFIPKLAPYAEQGFQTLATFPDWYVGGFMTITAAVFGIDKFWKRPKNGISK